MSYSIEYYGAKWCKVCVSVKPALTKLATDFDVKFSEYDIDDLEGTAQIADIKKVPTVRIYKDNELIQTIVTAHESTVKSLLASVKKIAITDDF